MRWQGRARSGNIEDRRGRRGALPIGGGLGIGGIAVILLISVLTGTNPADLLNLVAGTDTGTGTTTTSEVAGDAQTEFISVVLADTEQTWSDLLRQTGTPYSPPTLVLFTGATQSACGLGRQEMGPFYCPADRKVYLDLSFFEELASRFGAPGDFAQAYVVAHEVGHHIQTLTGLSARVSEARQRASERDSNALSVLQELQADCYAGVWGFHAAQRGLLEPGDAEEGLAAAAAIGDDTLQRQAQGRVVPESFTHGSSADRSRWLRRGLDTGDMGACDTFQTGS
jgi:predicted metalloprotease